MYALAGSMLTLVTHPAPAIARLHASDYAIHTEPKPGIRPRPALQGEPVHVSIPSLGLELPVKPGIYNPTTSTWTIDHSGAYHADISMPANESNGTTLIYAHAQSGLFDTLDRLRPGAVVSLATDSGHTFVYTYDAVRQVDPTDVSVFQSSGPPTLVLQNCGGDWSQFRNLYSFHFTKVLPS